MRQLSEKVAGLAPSATMEITNRARQLQQDGVDVISLSIGEPDFDTPEHIKDACIRALCRGETHYAPSNGIPELQKAIASKIERENRFPCRPAQVLVTCGGKDAIFDAVMGVVNPGEEVIILDPSWTSLDQSCSPSVALGSYQKQHLLVPLRSRIGSKCVVDIA